MAPISDPPVTPPAAVADVRLRQLAPEAALLVAAVATALGAKLGSSEVSTVAGYVTAAIAGIVTSLRGPAAARTVKHRAAARRRGRKVKRRRGDPIRFPAFGLDWSYSTLTARQVRQAGADFACRYLSPDPAKNLTLRESQALGRAGIRRVVVWESTGSRAEDGTAAGVADAYAARDLARALKIPETAAIYFAIDFPATGPDVQPYFEGVKSILGSRTGAYGSYQALHYLTACGLIHYRWQTYAWSGGQWLPDADILQYDNGRTVFGASVDFDHAMHDQCGWF